MTDFSNVVNEEESLVAGTTGGGFVTLPPLEGVALLRLRDVLEFGVVEGEWQGTPKKKKPVTLTFELVHPRHKINKKAEGDPDAGPFTGDFVRYHEVTVRLNKSNSDKSKYMKLFNKMNYDGAVAVPKGKIPSFVAFAGKGFLGEITLNEGKEGKVYTNLDRDGEYLIGCPRTPVIDPELGTPTGEYRPVPVPEMDSAQRVFLWETGVSDEVYKKMWDSIEIIGQKNDGTPFKNWIQESILSSDNVALEGSRAQRLFATSQAEAELDDLLSGTEAIATPGKHVDVASTTSAPPATKSPSEEPADPLAALGI